MKKVEWETTERTELPNMESIRRFRWKQNDKFWGILEAYMIKQREVKEKREK